MSVEQAYIDGFVKQAAAYGLSAAEALELLKAAAAATPPGSWTTPTGSWHRSQDSLVNPEGRIMNNTPNSQPMVENPYSDIAGNVGMNALESLALKGAKKIDPLNKDKMSVSLGNRFAATKALKNVAKAVPGVSAGLGMADARDRWQKEDYTGAMISGLGAAGDAAQLFPHPVAKGVGLATSWGGTAANAARDINRYNNRPVEFRNTPPSLPESSVPQHTPTQQPLQLLSKQSAVEALALLKTAEKPGLWANIRAKRARGEKPAKPGDEDYPDKKQWNKLTKAAVAAWQRSEGKNPEGGLNAKGRASYKRETGGTLKAPVTENNPKGERAKRQNSFCSRMCGMKRVNTGSKAQSDPDSRINKSLRKWNCKCGEAHDSIIEKIACNLK